MKVLKYVLIGVAVVGVVAMLRTASFAGKEHSEADIKLLKDAAAALGKSNPDLANRLADYANREAGEQEDMAKEKNEKEEAGEKAEPKEERNEKY